MSHLGVVLAGTMYCSSALGAEAPAAKFKITSSRQPMTELVVEAEHPEPPVAFAAQELQRYVKATSGADLPVVHAPSQKPAIVLATRPFQQDRQALEDRPDHYRLSIDTRRLLIEGASPRAVLFGVYDVFENQLRLETGIFGLSGYQASGALGPEKSVDLPEGGRYLQQQRPGQIRFLNGLIAKTTQPQVKVRLKRALKPWSLWNKEPRFWAFPDFNDSNPP